MTQFVTALASIIDMGTILEPITHAFKNFKSSVEKHYNINSTIKELSKLSDRELNDIGISRGMIRSIAMETYYGKDNF